MTFETYIFKPNQKKVDEDKLNILFIAGSILFVSILYLIEFPGIGLWVVGIIAFALIRIKIQEDKKKGPRRYGSLTRRIIFTDDSITIGDDQYQIDDLQKLEISADDFDGGPGGMFSSSVGTRNFIEFIYKGEKFSYQFQIKNQADLELVQDYSQELAVKNNTQRF
jgi:hypothetical protein